MHIRNPMEWVVGATAAPSAMGSATAEEYWPDRAGAKPQIRSLTTDDIRIALAKGIDDFRSNRTDVAMLVLVYPVIGLLLAALAAGRHLLPLLFPLASGFALVAPFAAIWLYEISRRREAGASVSLIDAFGVLRSPQIGAIAALGGILIALLLAWLAAADLLFDATLGPAAPQSFPALIKAALTTGPGWIMTVAGIAIGFVFAAIAFAISVVSFPLLLDRPVTLRQAIGTSIAILRKNPRVLTLWAMILCAGVIIGVIPALFGLVITLPILGHASWHFYRRAVR
jgi:uncharacterized membrane protein